ncbi:G-type lectin S-receptor-like serine/threonine-protein kinase SD2-5 [Solanum tuberosum]|uniref:G-type lectin S-receptor-like serine/threonine-protein kinase SD2-5 n=1 Tax=Solanum tuberosum TaxID=4113 RepID=UPI0003D282F3|nr:PREDICTED: G-type lectin S-receptor-like serine/threonine-protein kinase SD2-5 [Solanum tuberosum]
MIVVSRLYFPIFLIIYLHIYSSRFAFSQHWWKLNDSLLNSTSGISTSWINRPVFIANSTANFYAVTPILLSGTTGPRYHICGFYCNYSATECVLGILLVIFQHSSTGENIDYIYEPQLVWSANRNRPVNVNATLQLGQDGNLVLTDSDGTLVWSSNTTGKSVSGLNLTETGNLVLFDKANRAIWQSFDHPTDCLLPGQNLVSGQNLIASVSASNWSEGLFTLTIRNGSWATYIDSDPPQFYYSSPYSDNRYFSFDGKTFTALKHPPRPAPQFIKLGADGHLRVYQQGNFFQWTEVSDILTPDFGNCGYPMVCGRYSICSNDGQCSCPVEGNFFRPSNDRRPHLGCTALMSISCNSSQYHSLVELKYTTYFAIDFNVYQLSSRLWSEAKKLEDCKRACLSNCSCKAIVWAQTQMKNCLFLNEVFSLIDKEERVYNNMTIFLKVHNSSNEQINHSPNISPGQKFKPYKVITGYTLAAFFGIISSITICFIIMKKKRYESSKGDNFLDLEPLLPGILTRFSYNDLKIITEDFSIKLGEGGFGSVYEGTLSDGTKIAVKHLDGLGQVKDSFLTEVKILGSIHHVNLVKLIGFCGEKSESFLIYEYMINGSLDRWISPENEENGLKWHTRKRIISDIAKGLAYLHEDCSHKIIHLDIKPQNILLDQYFNAKISDFGLSKLIEKDISKVVTRMRGTPGYLAPEWLSSVITEKVDVYAFGIVLLEILCGRKNLDWSQADEEDVHLLSVFRRKAEQDQLMDMVDKNNEDMQIHREEVTEMMSIAAWCLQGDFAKRPSMSLVVKVLEGLVTVETNLDYNFKNVAKVEAGNKQREATFSSKFPSILSGPR